MINAMRILVVEDEIELCRAIRLRLESAGYEVIEAYDGAAGLEVAKICSPALIILDLMLPKISGYNVARLLKEDASRNDIPIIILSARSRSVDVGIGMAVGASAYLVKPFDSQKLLDAVARLLKERPSDRRENCNEEDPDR